MAITYFQDTIFQTDSALEAPGVGTALRVAVNNTFCTKDYTLLATVATINTNVKVSLEGSVDGTNYAEIISCLLYPSPSTRELSTSRMPYYA